MLLFDTETLNIDGKRYCWEFAGIDTKTLRTYHYLNGDAIRKALIAKCSCESLMFFDRYQLKHASKFHWLDLFDFTSEISECMCEHKTITAYNIGFDAGVLQSLNIDLEGFNLLDLWGSFVKVIGCTKKYILWANANNYLTKTKIPRTDAETAYRFLSGIKDFKTPHLAIKDVEHELVIYKEIQRRKKAKHYGFFSYADLRLYFPQQ